MAGHRCGSPYGCREGVEVEGGWCAECQRRAVDEGNVGPSVRLAKIPNLDPRFQPRLATHPEGLVRLVLLERLDLTEPVLKKALEDPDPFTVRLAAAHPRMPGGRVDGAAQPGRSRALVGARRELGDADERPHAPRQAPGPHRCRARPGDPPRGCGARGPECFGVGPTSELGREPHEWWLRTTATPGPAQLRSGRSEPPTGTAMRPRARLAAAITAALSEGHPLTTIANIVGRGGEPSRHALVAAAKGSESPARPSSRVDPGMGGGGAASLWCLSPNAASMRSSSRAGEVCGRRSEAKPYRRGLCRRICNGGKRALLGDITGGRKMVPVLPAPRR